MPPAPSPENRGPTQARQPIRSNIGGILVIIASPILAVTVAIWYVSLDLYYVALTVVGAAFIAVGGIVGIEIGRRLRAVDARELMRRDTRPPIVLIRPPKEDRRIVHGAPVGNIEGGTRADKSAGRISHEITLFNLLGKLGPFVAAGAPGDRLAPAGAARFYMGEDETIEELKSLVRRASAIVVQPELDFGRLWEAVLVSTPVDLSRLLLLVPNPAVRPLRYVRIRDLVRERLGVELPAQERCPPCDAFLFEGGKPVPIVLDPPRILGLSLPEWFWRWLQVRKEDRMDGLSMVPAPLLVANSNLKKAAKPFLDRISARTRLEGSTS
jgi:hypothetical protein